MGKWRKNSKQESLNEWWLEEFEGWSREADNEWSKDGQNGCQPLAVGISLKTARTSQNDAEYVLLDNAGHMLTSLNGMRQRYDAALEQETLPTLKLAQAQVENEFRCLLKMMETKRTNISLEAVVQDMYRRPATDLYASIVADAAFEAMAEGFLPDEATLEELNAQIGRHVLNKVHQVERLCGATEDFSNDYCS